MTAARLRDRRPRLSGAEGFTIIETLIAAMMLAVGVLSAFAALDSARRVSLVAERRTSMAQRAQAELERVKSLPYNQVALTGAPASGTPQWSTTPGSPIYVTSGTCPTVAAGTPPSYQTDHNPAGGASTATEPVVVNGCSYSVNGATTTVAGGVIAPSQTWSDGRMSGEIYDFVTYTSDPTCAQTSTPGASCATTNDYKRITIVAMVDNVAHPSGPVIVAGYMTPPNLSSGQSATPPPTTCLNAAGQTVNCTNTITGGVQQYFLSDCSSSASSCSPPPCAGNTLHNTLVAVAGIAPAPDLVGTSLPTGNCLTGTTPTPPCLATDLSPGCQGLPIVPTPPACGSTCTSSSTTSQICGSGPPADNSKSHSFVTAGIPAGTTLNLTGAGSMTAYLQSGTGVAANVTLCLAVYLVPGGVLGSLTGNLLGQQIGATVSTTATVSRTVPTPVSFNFNLGSATAITGGGTSGLPRIEFVTYLAAAAGTNVTLDYDQVPSPSQINLVTQ